MPFLHLTPDYIPKLKKENKAINVSSILFGEGLRFRGLGFRVYGLRFRV